ncbi:vomeronasal type-2 receptor 26-like [Gastrophryne carolinensis]
MEAPNYSFRKRGEVVGFIGDSGFQTSHTMAQLLNVYRYTQVPKSRCNPRCHPGYRKAPNVHRHVCCYDCVPCSSFEISNITDSESCYRCPDEEWPDERKVKCIPKTYDFLSYENDTVVLVITMGTVIGCAITLFVLGSFIYHRNTPIVKANNRNVSFILLTSIFMSFFSVFLFLGRPVDITCMLRQASFGIFFTISVSSVLAKTIIVCIAFKATKPSSYWRKWVGVKVPYFVVLICSSVQVLICIIWLSVSSPYQEYDMSSYPGKIIIQCNEGSVICFYSVLGYLGFLAAVSFVLAFMVRTLPDSFNEAKYITFSMLVFCSVWIAMIPAYLSTRGKYMVAVEIFAILASSGGILSCIFFHKLYILILMPEMNTIKKGLMEKNVLINHEEYRSILALIFAVDEINKNPDLLPNVTLGYHIFNTCGDPKKTLGYVLQILSGGKQKVPNYSCRRNKMVGFIGDSSFQTSHAMSQLLSLYQYIQIIYRVNDPLLSNRLLYPNVFRIAQDYRVLFKVIISCLLHFGWNWVGIVTPSDGSGDVELQELRTMMAHKEICIDYVIKLNSNDYFNEQKMLTIQKSTAQVLIICGLFSMEFLSFFFKLPVLKENITLLLHESWTNIRYFENVYFQIVNCSLIILWPRISTPNLSAFMNGVSLATRPRDPLLEDLWLLLFHCLSQDTFKNKVFQKVYNFSGVNCTEESRSQPIFNSMEDVKPAYVYMGAYVLANALQKRYWNKSKSVRYGLKEALKKSAQNMRNLDTNNEELFFNERGEVTSEVTLANWIICKAMTSSSFMFIPLASFNGSHEVGEMLNITEDIIWKGGAMPKSQCNERCQHGFRKIPKEIIHVCCYDCLRCSEGEVSNETESESCYKCPEEEWPDEEKVRCIPKTHEFLFYDDIIALVFLLMTLLFSAITIFIIQTFIYCWDTPVVKANNRTVSIILLISILLSFLCVFLFLGRPVDITCMLRQTSIGILFSIAVSCILAKTFIVYTAFNVTKPGSSWKKIITVKVSNTLVLTWSCVQLLICIIWLSVSPPYQEYDMTSYSGKIIIQCNEGSVTGFYMMLGYLGFLVAVSFVLAFMVRTLPDTFNEAKYITFSMLVFCSVWIAMIPAYLSTRGKYMVAVEIFAILSSSTGLLGCIFFPKCYIILFKPELNTHKK